MGKKTGDIPFGQSIIEEAPIFSGCEDIERNKNMNELFSRKMGEHINATFRYPSKAKEIILKESTSLFVINKEGEITKIETKGGDPILQTEALRIVRLLTQKKRNRGCKRQTCKC